MMNDWLKYYIEPKPWSGRIDGSTEDVLRWHQRVQCVNLRMHDIGHAGTPENPIALFGFACDEGVRRNQGRTGASAGPEAIRQVCSNLPVHHPSRFSLTDFGDIGCADADLEQAQQALASVVARCQQRGYKTLLFGGGHEITWAHFSGLHQAWPEKTIGIINIDAHFDNRPVDPAVGPTSGTGFWQISRADQSCRFLAVGIQSGSNTPQLFDAAIKTGTVIVPAEDVRADRLSAVKKTISDFAGQRDMLYVTICMDVFSAAFAPGVSAPAGFGLIPDAVFMELWDYILKLPGVAALDVAEVCPPLDQDYRTARLAASLVFRFLNA
jgi:formiminoglutamase